MTEMLRTKAWLLIGLTDSVGGVLQLANGRLSFTARSSEARGMPLYLGHNLRVLEKKVQHPGLAKKLGWGALIKDEAVQVLDVPFDQVEQATFPWYQLGRGVQLVIRGEKFRFLFTRPSNTTLQTDSAADLLGDVGEFFEKGDVAKAWKAALSTKMPASRRDWQDTLESWVQKEHVENQAAAVDPAEIEASEESPSTAQAASTGIPELIKKLAELRDSGAITEDEFERKKAELLDRM
jgi:hypothetical protein